jgi:hypothetical protein
MSADSSMLISCAPRAAQRACRGPRLPAP